MNDIKYNESLLRNTVNYITHILGFMPKKDSDPESLMFTWSKDGEQLVTTIFYFTKENKDTDLECTIILDYLPLSSLREKDFYLHLFLTCQNEDDIYHWLEPLIDELKASHSIDYPAILNAETLNVTTKHTSIPFDKTFYIIQAKIEGRWQDVIFSRGCTPDKKARYYRNKFGVDTRVVRIVEHKSYSYEYDVTNIYHPNSKD